jgi:hypothetical protein
MSAERLDLTPDQVRNLRTRAQCLYKPLPREKLPDAVRSVVGIQAQQFAAMSLALRTRVSGLTVGDIREAIAAHGTLARGWLMRGTLHLVPAEDLRWMIRLFGPVFGPKGKRRRSELGLTEKIIDHGLREIQAILSKDRELTRHALLDKLIERRVEIPPQGQALIHLIGYAAQQGVLCLGAGQDNDEPTYVLIDQWLADTKSLSGEKAVIELASRYVQGYGPASPKDFAAWSGLTIADAKRAWAALPDAVEVQVEDQTLWCVEQKAGQLASSDSPVVRLLPAFDTYLLGYANRTYLVPPEHHAAVYHGGQTVPVVLVDGITAGVWRYERRGKRLKLSIQAFETFSPQIRQFISEEADDIGRLWASSVSITFEA